VLTPVASKTDLYPKDVDANKEIEDALKQATADNKRVLLVFGANWCYDCHVLDRALHEGAAAEIVRQSFLVVHVDIGEGEKNTGLVKTYKIPLDKGVPAVAVLRSDGHLLYSSGEGEFESARRMLKKDLVAFLNRWKVTAPQDSSQTKFLPLGARAPAPAPRAHHESQIIEGPSHFVLNAGEGARAPSSNLLSA